MDPSLSGVGGGDTLHVKTLVFIMFLPVQLATIVLIFHTGRFSHNEKEEVSVGTTEF